MARKIAQLQVGERFEGFYLIKSVNLRTSSNHKKYYDLMIADASGEVDAKIWGIPAEEKQLYKVGDILYIEADVTLWQEKQQVKIIKHRLINEKDCVDYAAIVPAAPLDAKEMYEFMLNRAEQVKNEDLKKMAFRALELHGDKIMYYPAAMRNHHAIRSGLLYHMYRMIKASDMLCELYGLHADLVFVGILFHDLEKMTEMNANELGIVQDYTKKGILVGHITSGVVTISTVGEELGVDPEIVLLLEHMVLSHHFEAEYGSPKKPMFAEAQMLHEVDVMDARMYDFLKANEETPAGEFSTPVFSLDRVRVYHSSFLQREKTDEKREEK